MLNLSANTLKAMSKAIIQVGELDEYRDGSGIPTRKYESSDLEVIFQRINGSWKFMGLSFWLFSNQFVVNELGAVYAIGNDEDPDEAGAVFSISDDELKLAVRSFLQWRVNVALKLKL